MSVLIDGKMDLVNSGKKTFSILARVNRISVIILGMYDILTSKVNKLASGNTWQTSANCHL